MMEDSKLAEDGVESQQPELYPKLDGDNLGGDESEDYRSELEKIEEEIGTLKQVLTAKEARAAELRKLIGITPLSQIKAELNKVQQTPAFVKTSETLKNAGQATASVFSSFGSSMSNKFSEMKNSNTFKSFEEKMEGVGSSIMAKVQGAKGTTSTRSREGSLNHDGEEDEAGSKEPVVEQPQQQQTQQQDTLPN